MTQMNRFNALIIAAALGACSPAPTAPGEAPSGPVAPATTEAPAGAYTLDPTHASLVFRVNHLGFSHYTGRFSTFNANLELDPAHPETASLNVDVDPRSLGLENPPAGFVEELLGAQWLDAAQFPTMTFRSTKVELTGANTARVTGDFTMHGATHPLALDVVYNGAYAGHPMDPHARIGFSGKGVLKRSDYGVAFGIPAPGTTMGVSDEVEIIVEAEFNGPAWTPPPAQ
jgi:polyisoprenoid-binding protein YceI